MGPPFFFSLPKNFFGGGALTLEKTTKKNAGGGGVFWPFFGEKTKTAPLLFFFFCWGKREKNFNTPNKNKKIYLGFNALKWGFGGLGGPLKKKFNFF